MGRVVILVILPALLGAGAQPPATPGNRAEKVSAPVLRRTFQLEGVGGPADRTGIPGRIDHMAYDPATRTLLVFRPLSPQRPQHHQSGPGKCAGRDRSPGPLASGSCR